MPDVGNDEVLVATIRKNANEQIRVTVGTYMGRKTVRVWVWYRDGDGLRPGRHGLAFGVEKVDELIAALEKTGTAEIIPFHSAR